MTPATAFAPIERPRSQALPAPRFRYSPLVQAGPFAWVSGLVGLDPATGALAEGGAHGQARQILANLRAVADEQGWPLDRLVVARIYATDFAAFPEINRAWEAVFTDIEPPARTSVGVQALPLGAAVEMEFQFFLGKAEVQGSARHGER